MADEQQGSGAERPQGSEYMERMREGGYGGDRDPATAADGATAGRGSGQSDESVAHRGAHDLTRGATEMPDRAERERERQADLIGE